jgi:hypothetical protein
MTKLKESDLVRPERVLVASLLLPFRAAAQDGDASLSPEHEAIAFLIGEWRTTSTFADGRTGTGRLEYRWVLGGAWMKVEFRGRHPDGVLWDTHVMQRWHEERGEYEAWIFPAEGDPLRYRGTMIEPGVYRIALEPRPGVVTGIDYHRRDDGSIYQENWVLGDEGRRVTLRTTYEPHR